MILFACDYQEGCLPEILERLEETNMSQTPGYGKDAHCDAARAVIRRLCGCPDADVHFLVGGTQTNTTVISSTLRPYQGVLCADTGHINVHETGAIEHTGHKVLALPSVDGKIDAATVRQALEAHFGDESPEHCVQPGMLYISLPTELGTVYSRSELASLKEVCEEYNIPLYIDGARLGYGLASGMTDVTLEDLASLSDAFYIGGTKQGTLFGEALVIVNEAMKKDFRYNIKQGGGMLAKGRLLGLQFETLLSGEKFEDTLYWKSSSAADALALRIRDAFRAVGCDFLVESGTNQQFPILPQALADALSKDFVFERWKKMEDGRIAVRFCTSWATKERSVAALEAAIAKFA